MKKIFVFDGISRARSFAILGTPNAYFFSLAGLRFGPLASFIIINAWRALRASSGHFWPPLLALVSLDLITAGHLFKHVKPCLAADLCYLGMTIRSINQCRVILILQILSIILPCNLYALPNCMVRFFKNLSRIQIGQSHLYLKKLLCPFFADC